MNRELRLRKNEDFQRVYQSGTSAYNRDFQIVGLSNKQDTNRYGFSLSKKFGKAHERNRMKRQLKEIVRQEESSFPQGYDFVIIPHVSAKDLTYKDLQSSLFHCLRHWSPTKKKSLRKNE